MPLYKWYGTKATVIEKGKQFARNPDHLERIIAQQRITLIAYTHAPRPLSVGMLATERTAILSQLGTLLCAGVRIIEALETIAASTHHNYIKLIIIDCIEAIQEGMSLSDVAAFHDELFPPLAYRMFAAGEQTGKLGHYCVKLAEDYTLIDSFIQKIRSLLIMPCITLTAGISLFFVMLYAIVPRMGKLLSSMNGPLPRKTALLLNISAWIRTPFGTSALIACIIAGIIGFFVIRRSLTTHIPVLFLRGALFHDLSLTIFLRTLGLLLEGGISLTDALLIAPWTPTASYYAPTAIHVMEGESFSEALCKTVSPIDPLCVTLLRVGETTGKLGAMATLCGIHYQERVMRWCTTMSTFIQPCILIIIGALIALMMVAMYEPMLTLGTSIA